MNELLTLRMVSMRRNYYFLKSVNIIPFFSLFSTDKLFNLVVTETFKAVKSKDAIESLLESIYLKFNSLMESEVKHRVNVILQVFQSYFSLGSVYLQLNMIITG